MSPYVKTIFENVIQNGSSKVILCGDFNLVFNPLLDKQGGNPVTNFKCHNTLLNWMEETNSLDIWRIRNPKVRKYTWVSNTKPPIFCRLDHFLVFDTVANKILECNILPGYCSDHSLISLTINTDSNTTGRGLWKLNSNLLADEDLKIQ